MTKEINKTMRNLQMINQNKENIINPSENKLQIGDLGTAYQQEINNIRYNIGKEAAINVFRKLAVSPEITTEQLFKSLTDDHSLWLGLSELPALEFARILLGREKQRSHPHVPSDKKKRNKLSVQQSTELKQLIMHTLQDCPKGLTRLRLVESFNKETLKELGLSSQEANIKIRRPLVDLVKEQLLHKAGEKKGVRYIPTFFQKEHHENE